MQAKSDLLVDSDEKENLLAAAAELSDATTELLAAAKVCLIQFVLNFSSLTKFSWWFSGIIPEI